MLLLITVITLVKSIGKEVAGGIVFPPAAVVPHRIVPLRLFFNFFQGIAAQGFNAAYALGKTGGVFAQVGTLGKGIKLLVFLEAGIELFLFALVSLFAMN